MFAGDTSVVETSTRRGGLCYPPRSSHAIFKRFVINSDRSKAFVNRAKGPLSVDGRRARSGFGERIASWEWYVGFAETTLAKAVSAGMKSGIPSLARRNEDRCTFSPACDIGGAGQSTRLRPSSTPSGPPPRLSHHQWIQVSSFRPLPSSRHHRAQRTLRER